MTERLYYHDSYLRDFDARVVYADVADEHCIAVLDRTAFYPASGGQPCDTGTLGTTRVLEVIDDPRGILHLVASPLVEGEAVRGTIDWERRFDHMQQHTGQHVLSAAFNRLVGARTESFHLGATSATIDLSRLVAAAEITRVEEEANRIVWEDRPVSIRFAEAANVPGPGLRKQPARTGTVRLIEVEELDLSACGGTHVARTGAIGVIVVAGWEKFRGGTRINFLCGGRALRTHRSLRDATAASIKLLSVLPSELPDAIERLQGDEKHANRTIHDLQKRLASHEAERLIAHAAAAPEELPATAPRMIVDVLEGWDQNGLKAIASAVTRQSGYLTAVISAPAPSAVVIARSADVTTDAADVLRKLMEQFGGKGGGRADLAQGGGLEGHPREIASAARALLQS